MDLTFNVLESIRRDVRELSDDLRAEKNTRMRQVEELQKDVKDIRRCTVTLALAGPLNPPRDARGDVTVLRRHRDVRYMRQEVVAEHEARETSIENLRRELAEEMRREVSRLTRQCLHLRTVAPCVIVDHTFSPVLRA